MLTVMGWFIGAANAQQTLYDDQLASGWGNYSWAAVDFRNAAPVHGGQDSIRVAVAAGSYGALELRAGPFDAAKYGALTFWINGGTTGGQNRLVVKASLDGKPQGGVALPALEANTWKQVTVPLAALGVARAANLTGFLIQQNYPAAAPAFFVDDIRLTAASAASPNAAPAGFTIPKNTSPALPFTGVNLSGGEFGGPKPGVPQIYGTNFIYPSPAEFGYFAGQGVNIVRLPFHWETLQPTLNQPLIPAEVDRLKAVVSGATAQGLVILLDPHNYARYYDKVVGSPDVPDAAFADFWGRLAGQFRDDPRVWFGLMNEPHDMPTDQWLGAANAAIAAVRRAGAKNLILVPGNGWTSASGWAANGNAVAMLQIHDPAKHYIFEVHSYYDSDSSGTKPSVVSPTVGVERLRQFTLWCRQHHQRAFLGEFGAGDSPEAQAAVDNTLAFMEQSRDVWAGFTWWAAGPWWGDYMFSVEPKGGQDRPQMAYLRPYLNRPLRPVKVGTAAR